MQGQPIKSTFFMMKGVQRRTKSEKEKKNTFGSSWNNGPSFIMVTNTITAETKLAIFKDRTRAIIV